MANTTRRLTHDELVEREARKFVEDLLEQKLAEQDLPLPKTPALEIHIQAVLKAKPEIYDIARQRVDARQDAYTDSLRAIGLDDESVEIDLDIEAEDPLDEDISIEIKPLNPGDEPLPAA